VLIVTILDHLYAGGALEPTVNARIAQYAENMHFGKPCGLMDQTTCAVGGLVTIDFADVERPVVRSVKCDLDSSGYTLFVVNTGGSHADLNDDYSSLEHEMKAAARALGAEVLRKTSRETLLANLASVREMVSDRAVLRAMHFFGDDERVVAQVQALESGRTQEFLRLVIESGRSSWMLCQNCYSASQVTRQGLCIALALSEQILAGKGAWRVHGGGFEGTIQAFVPHEMAEAYRSALEAVFGTGACHRLFIRASGARCLSDVSCHWGGSARA
jgi:galactokinase